MKTKKKGGIINLIFKLYLLFSILSVLIILLVVWDVFLSNVVPWHWSYYLSYEDYPSRSLMADHLEESASNVKYYYGARWFVDLSGYGVSLSDEDYNLFQTEAVKRYEQYFKKYDQSETEERYIYKEGEEKRYLTEEYIQEHDIAEVKKLIIYSEQISDYYIFLLDDSYDSQNYLDCILCNDKNKRIIEFFKNDKNYANKHKSDASYD